MVVDLILDESKWPAFSMAVAIAATALLFARLRGTGCPARRRVLAAMTLFFGVAVWVMGFGHVLAVSILAARGTLDVSLTLMYLIGVVLLAPSTFTVWQARRVVREGASRMTLVVNLMLAGSLIVLGPHNLPIAIPGLLNAAYQLHERPVLGKAIATTFVLGAVVLFAGSVVFFASGQSFEQFRGI